MLPMLLVTAALMKFHVSEAKSKNSEVAEYYSLYSKEMVLDNDYMSLESRNRYERDQDADKRKTLQKLRKFVIPKKNLRKDKVRKRYTEAHEEVDVVDREDHITQFLADMFVNTDSEITILQAAEPEDGPGPSDNEEAFFHFLSRQANERPELPR